MRRRSAHTHFPGGRVPLAAFRAVVESALSHGDGRLHLGCAHDLRFECRSQTFPELPGIDRAGTVVSTLPFVGLGSGTPWLTEGAYATAIESAATSAAPSVVIADPRLRCAPSLCGHIHFLADEMPDHWRVVLCQPMPPHRVSPPLLLHGAYVGKAAAALGALLEQDATPSVGRCEESITHAIPTVVRAEPWSRTTGIDTALHAPQGFVRTDGAWSLVLPCGGRALPAEGLLDLCLLCREGNIQHVGLTALRCVVVSGIPENSLTRWRRLLARHRMAANRAEAELLWLSEDGSNEVGVRWASELADLCPSSGGIAIGVAGEFMPAPDTPLVVRRSRKSRNRYDVLLWEFPETASGRLEVVAEGLKPRRVPETLARWIKRLADEETRPMCGANERHATAASPTEEASDEARPTCTACLTEYDAAFGDPAQGVAPGTTFDDVPDSWVCPVCESPRHHYQPTRACTAAAV